MHPTFRPGRAGWDAIAAICHGITFRPQYALKVDIAKGVDRLCHDALLVKTPAAPVIRRQLNAWRKAGSMEENRLFPTTAGTPQGGSIPPVLALIALHGMDEAITHGNGYAPFWSSGRRSDPPIDCNSPWHANGDWREISEADRQENEYPVQHGFRILSAYTTSAGDQIWILTEADRSATAIWLPEEY